MPGTIGIVDLVHNALRRCADVGALAVNAELYVSGQGWISQGFCNQGFGHGGALLGRCVVYLDRAVSAYDDHVTGSVVHRGSSEHRARRGQPVPTCAGGC